MPGTRVEAGSAVTGRVRKNQIYPGPPAVPGLALVLAVSGVEVLESAWLPTRR